jgi:hypothetical protein
MTIEQKNPPKKEGGALSAITTLFGKKNASQSNLEGSSAVIEALSAVPAVSEKEAAEMAKKIKAAVGAGITFSEEGAAERLSISPEDVTWLRKGLLKLGEDFVREGGYVRITGRGLGTIATELELGTTLICLHSNLPNPKIVLARRPGNQLVLRVRVADSSAWCKGMLLQGCIPTDNEQIFICEARPKYRGKI